MFFQAEKVSICLGEVHDVYKVVAGLLPLRTKRRLLINIWCVLVNVHENTLPAVIVCGTRSVGRSPLVEKVGRCVYGLIGTNGYFAQRLLYGASVVDRSPPNEIPVQRTL